MIKRNTVESIIEIQKKYDLAKFMKINIGNKKAGRNSEAGFIVSTGDSILWLDDDLAKTLLDKIIDVMDKKLSELNSIAKSEINDSV